jgi:hypothetical protein
MRLLIATFIILVILPLFGIAQAANADNEFVDCSIPQMKGSSGEWKMCAWEGKLFFAEKLASQITIYNHLGETIHQFLELGGFLFDFQIWENEYWIITQQTIHKIQGDVHKKYRNVYSIVDLVVNADSVSAIMSFQTSKNERVFTTFDKELVSQTYESVYFLGAIPPSMFTVSQSSPPGNVDVFTMEGGSSELFKNGEISHSFTDLQQISIDNKQKKLNHSVSSSSGSVLKTKITVKDISALGNSVFLAGWHEDKPRVGKLKSAKVQWVFVDTIFRSISQVSGIDDNSGQCAILGEVDGQYRAYTFILN